MNRNEIEDWDLVLRPKRSLLSIDLLEIWRYRDLLSMFVKRDIITVYKQTILGPLWYLIQPILTTIIYMFVFGHVAGLSTDGAPQVLFYLAGITIWNYFSDSFSTTSKRCGSLMPKCVNCDMQIPKDDMDNHHTWEKTTGRV